MKFRNIVLLSLVISTLLLIGCTNNSRKKLAISDTEKMFITKDGEYFDFYRLKQIIEKDTNKECSISDFTVSSDKEKHNDAYNSGLETYECDIITDSWANGKWQLQKHFGEEITTNPKNGYAFPLYIDESLENHGTILAWKLY